MITVEELISVVHRHTDPIRITVVMGDAQLYLSGDLDKLEDNENE